MRISNPLAPAVRGRRGKILVLTGALMPVLVGGVGLTVDTGLLGAGRAHIRTSSDAGSLAGALQLAAPSRLMGTAIMTDLIANAQTAAIARGQSNAVLGQTPTIGSGDVTVGYINPYAQPGDSDYGQFITDSSRSADFNTVQVLATRSAIPALFGRIFGAGPRRVQGISRATVQNVPVAGYDTTKGTPSLLPIVLDKTTYEAMVNGQTTDEYSYDPVSGNVSYGSDGFKESRLYPVKTGNPGNWGTVKIGVNNNSTSTLGSQIRYGITSIQMQTEFPSGELLDNTDTSSSPPTPYHTFGGNPGISAGIKDDLTSIIGKAVTIPIYDQTGGNGNNAWYRAIEFAGVRILDVNFQGSNKYVIIQPATVTDPTAIPETDPSNFPSDWMSRSWTSGGIIRLYLSQ